MKAWAAGWVVLPLCVAACARPPTRVSLPAIVHTIAVLPPNNRTGEDLLVSPGSFLGKYVFDGERISVPDILAAEARAQLAQRGYAIVPPETVDTALGGQRPHSAADAAALAARHHIDASILYLEIRRWEPNGHFNPDFVIVSVTATLIAPSTGDVLWTVDRPSRPIPTPGIVALGQADIIAAAKVAEEMLAGLGPVRPAHAGGAAK